MRRALNVLQACHAAYDTITEDEIYICTGQPHPSDVERVVRSCLGDDFGTAYSRESFILTSLSSSCAVIGISSLFSTFWEKLTLDTLDSG